MTERNMWKKLRDDLKPWGRLVRVENSVEAGTPDVCYCLRGVTGWLELKYLPRWPARPTTPLVIPSLTVDQVQWLLSWKAAGGRAFLYLGVASSRFILTPEEVLKMSRRDVNSRLLLDGEGYATRVANVAQLVKLLS